MKKWPGFKGKVFRQEWWRCIQDAVRWNTCNDISENFFVDFFYFISLPPFCLFLVVHVFSSNGFLNENILFYEKSTLIFGRYLNLFSFGNFGRLVFSFNVE